MSTLTEGEIAYAAGLFEGEGCVNISRSRTRTGGTQWLLNATVRMTDREPLEHLHAHWGGSISRHVPPRAGRKDLFTLRMVARQAGRFLADIEPFLQSERRKNTAALAIAFQAQKRIVGRRPPVAYLEAQERFYHEMRFLNSGTPPPCELSTFEAVA